MPENANATSGQLVASRAMSTNGNGAPAHHTIAWAAGDRAIWRNADHDLPVVISGLAGEHEGVRYYQVQGSSTGIPEHELLREQAASVLGELQEMLEQAKVEPADILSAKKVAALLPEVATYQGIARQAALEALRVLIGYLPTAERNLLTSSLSANKLFDTQKELEQFLFSCPEPPGSPAFKPKNLADLLSLPPKQWLIDQVLGAGDVVLLYGPPGSGKTFVVIDLLFAACLGRQFAMRFDVPRALTVAYTAGEGVSGLPQRFAAAAEHYGTHDLPTFTFFDAAPQLFTTDGGMYAETLERFVNEWKDRQAAGSAGQLDLLVIDTLHSATVGADENSAQDMGKVLAAVRGASRALGCAVLLVHHSNKAGTGERGSSSIRGAMDMVISVAPASSKFSLSCEKAKDAPAWKAQTFDLIQQGESVRVWWDEPTDQGQSIGQKAADKERLLAELKRYAGKRFTAKSLAEVLGKSENYSRNLLVELEREGKCKRGLHEADKPQSSRNPWVYYVIAAGSSEGSEE